MTGQYFVSEALQELDIFMQVGQCMVWEQCDGRDFGNRSSELPSRGTGPPVYFGSLLYLPII